MEDARALRDRLARDGFAVVEALDRTALGTLASAYAELPHEIDGVRFFASHAALAPDPRRAVSDVVLDVLGPVVRRLLPGSRPIAGALLSKPAHQGTPLDFHQDLTYTREHEVRSYVCWAPLVDTDAASGALRVVPGSHRWAAGFRPGGPTAMATEGLQGPLGALATTLEVPAGHAVVWDSALIHGSWGNAAPVARPVATVALLDAEVPITYAHRGRDGVVEGFELDEEWFFTPRPFVDRPTGYPTAPVQGRPVTAADLAAHVATAAR